MATMNISLPDKLKAFVEESVEEGNFSNVSEYMRDIIREKQGQKAYAKYLKDEINAGLKSPVSDFSRSEALRKMQAAVAE
jgi:antitoxin ParD1/3/4